MYIDQRDTKLPDGLQGSHFFPLKKFPDFSPTGKISFIFLGFPVSPVTVGTLWVLRKIKLRLQLATGRKD